jgi:NADH:ubiquinone oxidoreductase subunit 6 (subunit J)
VAIGIMMVAMITVMIVKRKEEELTGKVLGTVVAGVEAIGKTIGKTMMMIVTADHKRSGRSTGDRDLPPDNMGARKHLSTTLTGMYV